MKTITIATYIHADQRYTHTFDGYVPFGLVQSKLLAKKIGCARVLHVEHRKVRV